MVTLKEPVCGSKLGQRADPITHTGSFKVTIAPPELADVPMPGYQLVTSCLDWILFQP